MITIIYGTDFEFEYEVELKKEDFKNYTQIPGKNVDFLFNNGWMSVEILEDMYENGDDDEFRDFIKEIYEDDAINAYNDMYDEHIISFDYDAEDIKNELDFERQHGN